MGWGGGGYSASPPLPPKKNPAAKFASQGDAHVRTDAQSKFLYYPLSRCFTVPFFTNPNAPTTIGIIDIVNYHILSTSI